MFLGVFVRKRTVDLSFFSLFVGFVLVFYANTGNSQNLSVGITESIEDSVRRAQLLHAEDGQFSYMIRPIALGRSVRDKKSLSFLPVIWRQQYNVNAPYGMNNGPMVPAKGYQSLLSAGVYAKYAALSVQLQPEFVFAQNKDFRELLEEDNGTLFSDVYAEKMWNVADVPERFGQGNYSKLGWGQSSLRLTFDPVSLGVSNENLWWGPGIRSSLLMSNNAPGFKHLTINTSRPVDIYVGEMEAQLVAGRLESSGVERDQEARYVKKRDDWRYLSGIVMTYQPKWVPGLYLGFDRSFIAYHNDISGFGGYFPLFTSVAKAKFYNPDNSINTEDQASRDQYISFFARWLMPSSKSEVYFQFGRNDHSWDLRDAFVEPEHSRAYIAGFRKLLALKAKDEFLQLGFELTRLAGTATGKLRAQPSWYVHHQVTHGYTNEGQVLGAGIGTGSNLWTLDLSWVKGVKKIGMQVENLAQNADLFNYSFEDGVKNWSDLSVSGKVDYDFQNFMVNTQLVYINSSNFHYKSGRSAANFSLNVGIFYFFK